MCTYLVEMSNIYNLKKRKKMKKTKKGKRRKKWKKTFMKKNVKMAESNRRLHDGLIRLFNLAHPLLLNSNQSDHIRNVFV